MPDPNKKIYEATNDIFEMFTAQRLSSSEGLTVLAMALATVLIHHRWDEQAMHKLMTRTWTEMQERLRPKRGEKYSFETCDQLKADADKDPELAQKLRDMSARIRQALDGLAIGRFKNLDEAMRSIGGVKVEDDTFCIDDNDDD